MLEYDGWLNSKNLINYLTITFFMSSTLLIIKERGFYFQLQNPIKSQTYLIIYYEHCTSVQVLLYHTSGSYLSVESGIKSRMMDITNIKTSRTFSRSNIYLFSETNICSNSLKIFESKLVIRITI